MVRSTFRAGYDGNAAIQCHSWHYHHAMNGMNGMMVHSTFRAGYAHLSLAFTLAHTNLTVHIHSTINVELAPRRREAVTVSGGWRSAGQRDGQVRPGHGDGVVDVQVAEKHCRETERGRRSDGSKRVRGSAGGLASVTWKGGNTYINTNTCTQTNPRVFGVRATHARTHAPTQKYSLTCASLYSRQSVSFAQTL